MILISKYWRQLWMHGREHVFQKKKNQPSAAAGARAAKSIDHAAK
jgi:hypothetical protein